MAVWQAIVAAGAAVLVIGIVAAARTTRTLTPARPPRRRRLRFAIVPNAKRGRMVHGTASETKQNWRRHDPRAQSKRPKGDGIDA